MIGSGRGDDVSRLKSSSTQEFVIDATSVLAGRAGNETAAAVYVFARSLRWIPETLSGLVLREGVIGIVGEGVPYRMA